MANIAKHVTRVTVLKCSSTLVLGAGPACPSSISSTRYSTTSKRPTALSARVKVRRGQPGESIGGVGLHVHSTALYCDRHRDEEDGPASTVWTLLGPPECSMVTSSP